MSELDRAYGLLRLERDATADDVREAHRFLVKAFHPDRFGSTGERTEATERLKEINHAKDVVLQHLGGQYRPPPSEWAARPEPESTPHPAQEPPPPPSVSSPPKSDAGQRTTRAKPDLNSGRHSIQRTSGTRIVLTATVLAAGFVAWWSLVFTMFPATNRFPRPGGTPAANLAEAAAAPSPTPRPENTALQRSLTFASNDLTLQLDDHGNGLASGRLSVNNITIPLKGDVSAREFWLKDAKTNGSDVYINGTIELRRTTCTVWMKGQRFEIELTRRMQ